jgi:hypothetical protein
MVIVNLVATSVDAAGASTAIYGLFAAYFLILRRLGRDASSVIPIIVINVVLTFTIPGISIAGHLGGLVTGAPNSPHLQAATSKAQFLVAIAANDDQRSPTDKDVLKDTFANVGVEVVFADLTDVDAAAAAIAAAPTRVVYAETIANPTTVVTDHAAVARLAHADAASAARAGARRLRVVAAARRGVSVGVRRRWSRPVFPRCGPCQGIRPQPSESDGSCLRACPDHGQRHPLLVVRALLPDLVLDARVVNRSSGSFPRLPISITLFSDISAPPCARDISRACRRGQRARRESLRNAPVRGTHAQAGHEVHARDRTHAGGVRLSARRGLGDRARRRDHRWEFVLFAVALGIALYLLVRLSERWR